LTPTGLRNRRATPQAAALLRQAFAKRGYTPRPLAMGTNTDPYQPIERDYRITRQVLELCLEVGHPVTITTKSARVLDDLDLPRAGCAAGGGGDLDHQPRPAPVLAARTACSQPGQAARCPRPAGRGRGASPSWAFPVIPAITDCFIEDILMEAGARGVRSASWIMVRLPHEVAPLFREWLDVHFPDRAGKVMHIIQSMRGGKD
jgi:DNA repair photolyase